MTKTQIARVIDNYLQQSAVNGPPQLTHPDYEHLFFNPLLKKNFGNPDLIFQHQEYDQRLVEDQFSRGFQEELLVDYDWRFSNYSLTLIRKIIGARANVLFLGTPMPFFYMESLLEKGAVLVDRNTLYNQQRNGPGRFLLADVNALAMNSTIDILYDAVILDPPWNLKDAINWARMGASYLKPTGIMAVSLFPPNVREHAAQEIDLFLQDMSRIFGSVSHYIVAYNSPSFEKEIFESRKIPYLDNWRRGVLLVFGNRNEIEVDKVAPNPTQTWERWRHGNVSVARLGGTDSSALRFGFYDNVSGRDPLWAHVKMINSRNWVGTDDRGQG